MPLIVDELSPDYVGSRRIKLSLADPLSPLRAFSSANILVDVSAAAPEGLVLPVEMMITSPSPSGFTRRFFRRIVPSEIGFIPREGGTHTILLREVGHNRWWGALTVSVSGEITDPRAAT